jgi:DNA-binding MarR family transcriptional regulator
VTKSSSKSPEESELVGLIGEAFRYSRRAIEQVVRTYGITAAQLGILWCIERQAGLSGAEIARQNFISPQAAHTALTTLETKGLIVRETDDDHMVRSHLTRKGKSVLGSCRRELRKLGPALADHMTVDERRTLMSLLRRYVSPNSD